MNRWLALLLAAVGAGVVTYAALLVAVGGLMGVLWLFVFGDDSWPGWVNGILGPMLFAAAFLCWAWLTLLFWRRLRGG